MELSPPPLFQALDPVNGFNNTDPRFWPALQQDLFLGGEGGLFGALERSVRQTSNRQLVRVKRHINDPEFASAIVNALRPLVGRPGTRRKVAR